MAIIERAAIRKYGETPDVTLLRCAWFRQETLWRLERDAAGRYKLVSARFALGLYRRLFEASRDPRIPDGTRYPPRRLTAAVRPPRRDGSEGGVWRPDAAGVDVFTTRATDIFGIGARGKRQHTGHGDVLGTLERGAVFYPPESPDSTEPPPAPAIVVGGVVLRFVYAEPPAAFKRRCPLKGCPSHKVDGVSTFTWPSVQRRVRPTHPPGV